MPETQDPKSTVLFGTARMMKQWTDSKGQHNALYMLNPATLMRTSDGPKMVSLVLASSRTPASGRRDELITRIVPAASTGVELWTSLLDVDESKALEHPGDHEQALAQLDYELDGGVDGEPPDHALQLLSAIKAEVSRLFSMPGDYSGTCKQSCERAMLAVERAAIDKYRQLKGIT